MNMSEKCKQHVDSCRFCWMCHHICPIGNATGHERSTARARALGISLVNRGAIELDEIMDETRAEEDKLKAKVKELEAKIEPRLLTSFKRIRKNARNGLGIVYVQRDACGGCFNKIPPQRQLDIKMHKKVIVCEYCGRILIDPELAGLKRTATLVLQDGLRGADLPFPGRYSGLSMSEG